MTDRMKTLALFGLLLVLSVPLFGQRSAARGGGARSGGAGMGGGSRVAGPRPAVRASYFAPVFAPVYGGGYSAPYGFGAPIAYATDPYPENPNGGPTVIVSSVPGQAERNVVYIPSYMRENNGPSLAEIAAQLKTEHQPAKYIWRNVEPLLERK